jgi:hypothetical protein
MKSYVIFLLTFLGVISTSSLNSADVDWHGMYENKVSPSRIYRLWLNSNQSYLLALYEKNRITLDSGSISFNKREVRFKSSFSRNSVTIKENQKIYLAKKGLYEGTSFLRRKLIWKKN